MKASEALRKGSKMVEPVRGMIEDSSGRCCALGMMGKAATGCAHNWSVPLPWGTNRPKCLPCGCHEARIMGSGGACMDRSYVEATVAGTVMHLFNYHVMTEGDWTTDQIADWLDTVDPSNVVRESAT